MDFTNFTTVPEWVQVLTKAKLPGLDNQSTQPPQWFALGPGGAKGKTCDAAVWPHATALPLAFALAWPHTHMWIEGMCAISTYSVEARGFFCTSSTAAHVFENTYADRGNVCNVYTVSVVYVCIMRGASIRPFGRLPLNPSIHLVIQPNEHFIHPVIHLFKTRSMPITNLWSQWEKGKRWLSHTCALGTGHTLVIK
jgi:hypothetical protein